MDDLQADIPPTAIPFREEPALRISLSADSSPLDFFSLFFDDVIIHMLVDGTNKYAGDVIAKKERAGKLTPKSRWVKWRPVTKQEMKAVLALIINMGIELAIGRCRGRVIYHSSTMFLHKTDLKKSSGCYIYEKT